MRKKSLLFSCICITALLTACGSQGESEEVLESFQSKEECMEAFLEEFFSLDKDARFSSMEEMNEEELEAYAALFERYVTEDCNQQLQNNRLPSRYDAMAARNGYEVTVEDVDLELYADDTYEFTVRVEIAGSKIQEDEFQGQISANEDFKVDNVYISKEADLR